MGGATVAVEPVEGTHGKYALHAHYPEMTRGAYAMAVATHLPDSLKTHVFGRAYMKITGTIPPSHNPLIITGEPGLMTLEILRNWPVARLLSIAPGKQTGQGRGEDNAPL